MTSFGVSRSPAAGIIGAEDGERVVMWEMNFAVFVCVHFLHRVSLDVMRVVYLFGIHPGLWRSGQSMSVVIPRKSR